MKEYHKIQSIYKRNPETNNKTFLEGEYSLPEFEYLKNNEWVFTEKVDGTNIRVMFNKNDNHITFGGKTDRASIPATLVNILRDMFCSSSMTSVFDCDACLYGEGYGPKIQKGGGNYGKEQSFVLFDVKVGDWWLKREDVEYVAEKLNIQVVPIIGSGTLDDAVAMTKKGFNSQWGDFRAEGIVARPKVDIVARNGQRIITKVKFRDFNN